MKLKIILFILLFNVLEVYAKGFTIPSGIDLFSIANKIEKSAGLNYIQRLIINQTVRNSSINGVKIKDFTIDGLIEYFNSDKIFDKVNNNTLKEKYTGATLEFISDGKCKKIGKCYIIADLNGEFPPNEIWINKNEMKDRVIFNLQKETKDTLKVFVPEFKD